MMELDRVFYPPDTKYTVIDYLLNIKAHDRAFRVLMDWNRCLADAFKAEEAQRLMEIDME